MDILFQPQRLIDIRIHSWCCVFMDLYEQIIECIHCLQCITQNSFYYKKKSVPVYISLPLHFHSWKPLIIFINPRILSFPECRII